MERMKSYRGGKHYRERAEECRVIAEVLRTAELREQMLQVAADYEGMADLADKLSHDLRISEVQPVAMTSLGSAKRKKRCLPGKPLSRAP